MTARNNVMFTILAGVQGLMTLLAVSAWALPEGAQVVAGGSTIATTDAGTMQINQSSPKSIINWNSYSIGANEKVQYLQPGRDSISLNRVTGADPSRIYGSLGANGQVWVINPSGLLIGPGARIEVGGLLGSTLPIDDQDFMAGRYTFSSVSSATAGNRLASISTSGSINAAGGYVVFIAPSVTNHGDISTRLGKTGLISGDAVTVTFAGNELIAFAVDKAVLENGRFPADTGQLHAAGYTGISNKGSIVADGGEVILSARVAGAVLKSVINNEGIITAKTVANKDGVIKLLGDAGTVIRNTGFIASSRGEARRSSANDGSPGNSGNAPGQSDGSPGNSGNAPGQSDGSPGNSGNAPGQSDDSPGNSGNAPGQSDTSPGNSGSAPGQSNTSPGNSGSAPGQSNTSPGNSGSAPGQSNANTSKAEAIIIQQNKNAVLKEFAANQGTQEQGAAEKKNNSSLTTAALLNTSDSAQLFTTNLYYENKIFVNDSSNGDKRKNITQCPR